jgi:hypothetical protein
MESVGTRKVLVHCEHNKRVPVFIALYRICRLSWSQEQALAAMREVWQPDAVWEKFIAESITSEG